VRIGAHRQPDEEHTDRKEQCLRIDVRDRQLNNEEDHKGEAHDRAIAPAKVQAFVCRAGTKIQPVIAPHHPRWLTFTASA
jgi:hypothetical protein